MTIILNVELFLKTFSDILTKNKLKRPVHQMNIIKQAILVA